MSEMVLVSNRLPFQVVQSDGALTASMSTGGLVTALRRVLETHQGTWVGWPGVDESEAVTEFIRGIEHDGFRFEPVFLSPEEREKFYFGFSNEIIWPLFHDLQSRCYFDPSYWEAYRATNLRFAQAAANCAPQGGLVWIHDYHLFEVGLYLRELRPDLRLAYFHHIPFPQQGIFEKLPWRREVLGALLEYDLVGFQTPSDRRNFVSCLRAMHRDATVRRDGEHLVVNCGSRQTIVGSFPISIDFEEFAAAAASTQVRCLAQEMKEKLGDCRIVLGVDRLDYTKGIPEKLCAYRSLLSDHPEVRGKICIMQLTVPSREEIPKYQQLRSEVERLVSAINGQFTQPGWVPIHYMHRSLSRSELVSYYALADIALVTPLKDGMNLVAKEYCAVRRDHSGVLVLSEFAGAAAELRSGALLVNPYDFRGTALALYQAFKMPRDEQTYRMRRMRRVLRRNDVFNWSGEILKAVAAEAHTSRTVVPESVVQAKRALAV